MTRERLAPAQKDDVFACDYSPSEIQQDLVHRPMPLEIPVKIPPVFIQTLGAFDMIQPVFQDMPVPEDGVTAINHHRQLTRLDLPCPKVLDAN